MRRGDCAIRCGCGVKAWEVDHVFICSAPGAPEAQALLELGLAEGAPSSHPGQGTANRRFFFQNAMLELLWIADEHEATSALTRSTHLWERWTGRGTRACPFGICLRPSSSDVRDPPFDAWSYRPRYLPSGARLDIAMNASVLDEPMLFFFTPPSGQPSAQPTRPQHRASLNRLTCIEIVSPARRVVSAELQAVIDTGLITLRFGPDHLLELGFDDEAAQGNHDCRPVLPLMLRW